MATDRKQIEERAAAFLQKRDTGPWTEADDSALGAWIEASVAHRVAFLRAEAAWEAMARLKALGAGLPSGQVPTPDIITAAASPNLLERQREGPRPIASKKSGRSTFSRAAGVAASLIAVAAVSFWAYSPWFSGQHYDTPIGGLASVPLEDGSHIVLNTASRVRVVLSATERRVELNQGEAFFEVAKDAKRPFVVQAKNTRIIAVGTQFSVRRMNDGQIQLLVTEGKVQVESDNPVGDGRATASALIAAGEVARIGVDGLNKQDEPGTQAELDLAWREGFLVFRDTALVDAIAEFNRYNARQLVISDANLARMPLTGKFRATNSEAFIGLLQQTFHIRAQVESDQIILTSSNSQ